MGAYQGLENGYWGKTEENGAEGISVGYFCNVRILERSRALAGTVCRCNSKCPLGAEERETRGKEAPGYLGGGGLLLPQ